MGKFFRGKNRVNFLLWVVSLGLFLILALYLGYSLRFLISKINQATNVDLIKSSEIVTVDLEKLQEIKKR